MKTSEIRLLLHRAAVVADPHATGSHGEQEMRELIEELVQVAGQLLEERDQLNRRLRRSAEVAHGRILAEER